MTSDPFKEIFGVNIFDTPIENIPDLTKVKIRGITYKCEKAVSDFLAEQRKIETPESYHYTVARLIYNKHLEPVGYEGVGKC